MVKTLQMLCRDMSVDDTSIRSISELFDYSTLNKKMIGIDVIPVETDKVGYLYLGKSFFARYLTNNSSEIYVKN